jgi:hypothetical protein
MYQVGKSEIGIVGRSYKIKLIPHSEIDRAYAMQNFTNTHTHTHIHIHTHTHTHSHTHTLTLTHKHTQ